jgi:WD40 repeat protein
MLSTHGQRFSERTAPRLLWVAWWNHANLECNPTLRDAIISGAFSPKEHPVSSSEDKTIQVWNIVTGGQVLNFQHHNRVDIPNYFRALVPSIKSSDIFFLCRSIAHRNLHPSSQYAILWNYHYGHLGLCHLHCSVFRKRGAMLLRSQHRVVLWKSDMRTNNPWESEHISLDSLIPRANTAFGDQLSCRWSVYSMAVAVLAGKS